MTTRARRALPGEGVPWRCAVDRPVRDGGPWELLVQRYRPFLTRVAASYDIGEAAEDAVARTFGRLIEEGVSSRPRETVKCWLAVTIRDECLTALRQRRREHPTNPANVDALTPPLTVVGPDIATLQQLSFDERGMSDAYYG